VLKQGTEAYNRYLAKQGIRARTLIDKYDITEKLIKDESVQISLREECPKCKGQLLEPKLKKSVMS
jgi:hypothetical protein